MFDQRGDHVAKHGPFVLRGAAKLAELGKSFSHDDVDVLLDLSCYCCLCFLHL